MDVQRSKKKGRANYFIVIPISSPAIRSRLREVQTHLENTYPTARSELRKAFTNLDSAEVHVTLIAIHANQARLQQVIRFAHPNQQIATRQPSDVKLSNSALERYQSARQGDQSFSVELKGLGSWTTKAGNIVLYADLSRDSVRSCSFFLCMLMTGIHS